MFSINSVNLQPRVLGLAVALLAVPAAFAVAGPKPQTAAKPACCAPGHAVKTVAKADQHEHAAKTKAACCEKKAACCAEKKACCKAEIKPCCAKKAECCKPGAKCCEAGKAHAAHAAAKAGDCCAKAADCCAKAEACCDKAAACCDEKATAKVKAAAHGKMDCCAAKPAAKK